MKLETIKENYDDFESALFRVKAIIKSLRKTYSDKTIIMAFKKAIKNKK